MSKVIGIDLGTTNCALAFAALDSASAESETLAVPQWDSASTLVESETLPSFLYLCLLYTSDAADEE